MKHAAATACAIFWRNREHRACRTLPAVAARLRPPVLVGLRRRDAAPTPGDPTALCEPGARRRARWPSTAQLRAACRSTNAATRPVGLRRARGRAVRRAGPRRSARTAPARTGRLATAAASSASVAARADAPVAGAIPWLLLTAQAERHARAGALAGVSHIQRLNTAGGVAPAGACANHGPAGARALHGRLPLLPEPTMKLNPSLATPCCRRCRRDRLAASPAPTPSPTGT